MNSKKLRDELVSKGVVVKLSNTFEYWDNATTTLEDADENTLVFYRFNQNPCSYSKFLSRLGEKKIACLICDFEPPAEYTGSWIKIKNEEFLKTQKWVADITYPIEKEYLKLVGVTGTNGKTSVVYYIKELAKKRGLSVLTIGTLGVHLDRPRESVRIDIGATTPSYLDLRKVLFQYSKKADLVALEVSSHSLSQDRLYDLKLDLAIWTSFSQDHLDYHETIEKYFSEKLKIIRYLKTDSRLYVSEREKDLYLRILNFNKNIVTLVEKGLVEDDDLPAFLKTSYNKVNVELAAEALKCLFPAMKNFSLDEIKRLSPPPGRFNSIEYGDRIFIIDYAHTSEALENICHSIRLTWKDKKLITVFGCGGDRDKKKRPKMREAALSFSDAVVITTDNPRSEQPDDIIRDILNGVNKRDEEKIKVESDRKSAIEYALNKTDYDIVLVAGKGHERFQEVFEEKKYFDDEDVVKSWIKNYAC